MTNNDQHHFITVCNEDGDPIYQDCVERGCTERRSAFTSPAWSL